MLSTLSERKCKKQQYLIPQNPTEHPKYHEYGQKSSRTYISVTQPLNEFVIRVFAGPELDLFVSFEEDLSVEELEELTARLEEL